MCVLTVVSAKRAVDNDLVQSALEEGELLIIELGDEQLGDPAGVDGAVTTTPRASAPARTRPSSTGRATRRVMPDREISAARSASSRNVRVGLLTRSRDATRELPAT
jgi:hypothetical protein